MAMPLLFAGSRTASARSGSRSTQPRSPTARTAKSSTDPRAARGGRATCGGRCPRRKTTASAASSRGPPSACFRLPTPWQ
jgi:hypothetical protein